MSRTKLLLFCLLVFVLSSVAETSRGHLYSYKVGNVTKTTSRNLTIHVIAHTHCDPGWLKTYDEYYLGSRNDVYIAGVRYIYDAVVQELALYPDRKFIVVEISFFSRWWKEQSQKTRLLVNKLIENGQLEFISGGWVMHDEATSYYEDQIDNFAVGHQFLKETFNIHPKIGWQIDPFGHSSTTASFFSQMGFDALWMARPDYQNKAKRLSDKTMEFMWTPKTSQGEENQIWTAFTYNEYAAPRGFCYDIFFCTDEPISYDPSMPDYNVEQKVQDITNYFRAMSEGYQSDHLIHTWGEDFQFQAAAAYYRNLDVLLEVTNNRFERYGIKLVYSTPSEYVKAIHKQNITFPKNTDDFFPYADRPNGFWTGYFTSRVSQKGYTRHSGRLFQNIRRLVSHKLAQNNSVYLKKHLKSVLDALASAEQNRALLQHHDAVAGTARQRVKEDYMYRMEKDMNDLHRLATNELLKEETRATFGIESNYTSCLLNTTAEACQITNRLAGNQSLLVAIHNVVQERYQVVRIKVPQTNIQVYTLSKTRGVVKLDTDIICANRTTPNDCDLYFLDHFNATSTQFYTLKTSPQSNQVRNTYKYNPSVLEEVVPVSPLRSLTMIGDHTTFLFKDNNQTHIFRLKLNYYPSYCTTTDQNSGAYIFRPTNNTINGSIPYTMPSTTAVFSGKVVTQVTLYSDLAITNIRMENRQSDTPGIELETFVDSINMQDNIGKEVVLLIETPDIKSNDEWYTDSNGQEMQKRKRSYRSTWNLTTDQFSSSNYYPVTSAIYIQDNTTGLRATLITDRAHGATSLQSGQIEVMLHRRIPCDDRRGVVEPLNETDWDGQGLRQWFNQRLVFSRGINGSVDQRTAQYNLDQPLFVLLSPHDEHFEFLTVRKTREISVNNKLPKNVKVSFKPYSETEFVVWIHNMNEANVTVPISTINDYLTEGTRQPTYQEVSLSANQLKAELVRNKMAWKGAAPPAFDSNHEDIKNAIQLRGLEIRCFKLNF